VSVSVRRGKKKHHTGIKRISSYSSIPGRGLCEANRTAVGIRSLPVALVTVIIELSRIKISKKKEHFLVLQLNGNHGNHTFLG
jgi:hypothetical protein